MGLKVRIDFHPEATRELEESADWYAERNPIAASSFVIAVDEALQKIEENPERFLKVDHRHQACSVERYPFQIVFRNDRSRIYIIGIAHAKRRPGYWRTR